MKRFGYAFLISLFILAVFSSGLAENSATFDESIFTNAGYTTKEDIFSGQKIIYKKDKEVIMLDYTTKMFTWGLKIDTKIFGKNAKEEGEMPAWTEGDNGKFHENQIHSKCYPFVVYNPNHDVPYSFVVALSLPPAGEYGWLANQGPHGIMIATDNHIYTLNRYLSSSTSFYNDIVFMTMDESGMEMFYDMNEIGGVVIRATSFDGKTVDFALKVPKLEPDDEDVEIDYNWSIGVKDVIAAWDLYVQAGGTSQDLTPYANAIEVKDR